MCITVYLYPKTTVLLQISTIPSPCTLVTSSSIMLHEPWKMESDTAFLFSTLTGREALSINPSAIKISFSFEGRVIS